MLWEVPHLFKYLFYVFVWLLTVKKTINLLPPIQGDKIYKTMFYAEGIIVFSPVIFDMRLFVYTHIYYTSEVKIELVFSNRAPGLWLAKVILLY